MAKITKEFLMDNRTKNGAWNKKQLKILNVPWPPPRGWHRLVIGKEIEREKEISFVLESGKDLNLNFTLAV